MSTPVCLCASMCSHLRPSKSQTQPGEPVHGCVGEGGTRSWGLCGTEECAWGEGKENTAVLGMEELGPAVWEGADCLPSIVDAGTSPAWPHLHLGDGSISLPSGSGWKLE